MKTAIGGYLIALVMTFAYFTEKYDLDLRVEKAKLEVTSQYSDIANKTIATTMAYQTCHTAFKLQKDEVIKANEVIGRVSHNFGVCVSVLEVATKNQSCVSTIRDANLNWKLK